VSEVQVILVIEDDQMLQAFVEEALSDGGFEAARAGIGEEAITLLIGQKDNYRALVTDINLLGRAEEWASKGVPNSVMLAKPFASAQLVTALAQLLNAAPPTAPHG
jgi:hypothetical protein